MPSDSSYHSMMLQWQERASKAEAEVQLLKGVIAADDKRLLDAEQRVWPGETWGCDAADHMAECILSLRRLINLLSVAK